MPIKWSQGIIHEASWVNNGPTSVNFGPTSDDEMMVLIAFYTLSPVTVGAQEPDGGDVQTVFATPNPARDHVAITLPGRAEIRQFQLFDMTGREVLRRSDTASNTVDISLEGLAPGIYLFNADGRTGKLVVE